MTDTTKPGEITIPAPHVPYGPEGVPEAKATADYLREAACTFRAKKPFGSNLSVTVIKLLDDAAEALDPTPTPEPWAGHPVKWCEEHDSLTEAQDEICDRSWEHTCATGGSQGPCDWQTYQPWVDLLAERDEAREELVALRVLDGASAERAEAERKAMAQQRDDACRERKQYKRDANTARRERNEAREALERAIAPWIGDEILRAVGLGGMVTHRSISERIMRERGFRDE